MLTLLDLWLAILLSAIAVFILSSVIHMFLTYHRNNFAAIANEDTFTDALRPLNIPAGEYMFPFAGSMKVMQSGAYIEKMNRGPVGTMVIMPNGPYAMAKNLINWFIYSLLVGLFSAYTATIALDTTASGLQVLQLVGVSSFSGYALALIQNSIWNARAWRTTFKFMFDGLVYALATGLIFAWLWPTL